MFTNITASYNNGDVLIEAVCLSTDTKPTTGVANGSVCLEMDTGDKYMFDEAGGQWIKLGSGGGGGAEVWLTGDTYTDKDGVRFFTLSDVGGTNHISELYDNGDNYQIFLNGGEVSYSATIENPEDTIKIYADGDTPQTATKTLVITRYDDASKPDEAAAQYPDIATAPDSVEVSVKAK